MKKVFIVALFLTVSLRGMAALQEVHSREVQTEVETEVLLTIKKQLSPLTTKKQLSPLTIGSLGVQNRHRQVQYLCWGTTLVLLGTLAGSLSINSFAG